MKKTTILTMLSLILAATAGAQTATHDVARSTASSQACLSLDDKQSRYYNTEDLSAIDVEGTTVRVVTKTQDVDVYPGNVAAITFAKKTVGALQLNEAKGWLESLYAEWPLMDGASSYNVYVRGGQYADFTLIDQQLVRSYGTYARADVVGLKPAADYAVRVVPVADGTELADKAAQAEGIEVKAYDRTGYAHFNYTKGVGAYNDDGTLKQGAQVIYVSAANAKTVKARLSSGEVTGLQAILAAYEKGNETTPLAVRIIGTIRTADMDAFESSAEGIQIKGRKAHSDLHITVEGIGRDATIYGFGFLCRNTRSLEFRNFAIMRCMDDGISVDTDNSHLWMHHLDLYYGKQGSGDKAKGDGAIDIKGNSQYVTMAYCHFWDTGKSNLYGMKSESGPNYLSYHHNWFDHSDSRHPRIRTMSVHVFNNYYDGNAKYGVGVTTGACCFAENNYFRHAHDPLLSSLQGTDAKGDGTFSGEDGGIIKAYGNVYAETAGSSYYVPVTWQQNSNSFDCYDAATRQEQVPATVKTLVGGHTYNNFDTDPALIYDYTPDAAADVPAIVTGYYGAGRLGHGDCQYLFDNATDDTDYDINTRLAALIDGYKTSLVSIYGDIDAGSGEQGGQGGEQGGEVTPEPVEGTILCTFDKSGTPSSTFFTVSGNGSNSKGIATIDGQQYNTCLKMEKETSIKFVTDKPMLLTLYFGDTETASIKINGVKKTSSTSTYSEQLAPGNYELTKADTRNLFGIKLQPVD